MAKTISPEQIRERAYKKALYYVENAKELLKKAGLERGWYVNRKYVCLAGHALYLAMLIALDAMYRLAGLPRLPKGIRKSKEYYLYHAEQLDEALADKRPRDKNLQRDIDIAYRYSHLFLGYDGICDKRTVDRAIYLVLKVIKRLAPRAPRIPKVVQPKHFPAGKGKGKDKRVGAPAPQVFA